MSMTTHENPFRSLDDQPLLDAAKRLTTEERCATAALLRALMEIDTRRLFLGEGCASMFVWCTQVLHLAEGAAYNRIEAARAAREYPVILELFEQSAITLTAVRLLAPHLTDANHLSVLTSARHKSKREIEELVALLRPKPDAPVVVRRLPETRGATTALLLSAPNASLPSSCTDAAAAPSALDAPPPARVDPARVTPVAPERYRIQLTVSRETHDKFRRAQALLRHAVPTGDAVEIFDRALTLLVESLERKRCGETARPRPSRPSTERSRYIPAAVRRAVWRRDGGRCAFEGSSGSLPRDFVPGVSPRGAIWRRWCSDSREHRASLPRTQRLRGAAVLRGRCCSRNSTTVGVGVALNSFAPDRFDGGPAFRASTNRPYAGIQG